MDARNGGNLYADIIEGLRTRISRRGIVALVVLLFATGIAAGIFNFESLDGLPWDLGYYVQATHSLATRGVPEATFSGTAIDYNFIHHSYDKYPLAWAYQVFNTPWVVPIWHEIFLLAPALICMLFYQAVCRGNQIAPEPLGYLLAFLGWAWNPTVLFQVAWNYSFNILGLTLLAFAYLLYYQRKWLWLGATLIALAFEKEEFGFISFTFCLMVAVEALFDRKLKRRQLLISGALAVAAISVSSYFTFTRRYPGFASFARAYGELGSSPGEAIKTLFLRPIVYIKTLTRADAIQYFLFFGVTSFVWLKPRFSVAKYMIPVLPLILLNSLNSWGMAQLNMHYSLPIMVGLCATLILGVFGSELAGNRAFQLFLLITLVPLLWGHEFQSRTLRKGLTLWIHHAQERGLISRLIASPDTVICCEDRLCTSLADHDNVFMIQACTAGSDLLKPYLGKTARFLVYSETKLKPEETGSGLPRAEVPGRWSASTSFIKISEPVRIIR